MAGSTENGGTSQSPRATPIRSGTLFWDVLQLLVTALDEFHAGRMVEVGDILASRLRMITVGLDEKTWGVACRFLVYHNQDHSLVSDELMDEALKVHAAEQKREKAIAAARQGDSRR